MNTIETARLIESMKQRIEELEYELSASRQQSESDIVALMDYYNVTHTEAKIIRVLANAMGGALSRSSIWELVGLDTDLRTIDSHIRRVRMKNKGRLLIGSIYGIGYRLTPDVSKTVRDVMCGKIVSDRPRVSYFLENRKQAAKVRRAKSALEASGNGIA